MTIRNEETHRATKHDLKYELAKTNSLWRMEITPVLPVEEFPQYFEKYLKIVAVFQMFLAIYFTSLLESLKMIFVTVWFSGNLAG